MYIKGLFSNNLFALASISVWLVDLLNSPIFLGLCKNFSVVKGVAREQEGCHGQRLFVFFHFPVCGCVFACVWARVCVSVPVGAGVDVRDHPPLLFHVTHRGRVSPQNPEL